MAGQVETGPTALTARQRVGKAAEPDRAEEQQAQDRLSEQLQAVQEQLFLGAPNARAERRNWITAGDGPGDQDAAGAAADAEPDKSEAAEAGAREADRSEENGGAAELQPDAEPEAAANAEAKKDQGGLRSTVKK